MLLDKCFVRPLVIGGLGASPCSWACVHVAVTLSPKSILILNLPCRWSCHKKPSTSSCQAKALRALGLALGFRFEYRVAEPLNPNRWQPPDFRTNGCDIGKPMAVKYFGDLTPKPESPSHSPIHHIYGNPKKSWKRTSDGLCSFWKLKHSGTPKFKPYMFADLKFMSVYTFVP